MPLDGSALGNVAAEQMAALERDYGDSDAQIGSVMTIVEVLRPQGTDEQGNARFASDVRPRRPLSRDRHHPSRRAQHHRQRLRPAHGQRLSRAVLAQPRNYWTVPREARKMPRVRRIFGGWAVIVAGVMLSGGFWMFVYAHYHNPYREDPMAVHVLSPTDYGWMHGGGIGLLIAGGVLLVGAVIVMAYYSERAPL